MANTSVYGIYSSRSHVELGVDQLLDTGFRDTDISVLVPHNDGSKDFAVKNSTKMPEGAAAGAGTGALAGGALGWLAGLGALTIPGVGPFIAAGPILTALAGATIGGSVAGLGGALIGMGIPEYEARRYARRLEKGGILLSVHCADADKEKSANEILKNTGAEDISFGGEATPDYDKTDESHRREQVVTTQN